MLLVGKLSGNEIGDDGVEALSEALNTNTTVRSFYIGGETLQIVSRK